MEKLKKFSMLKILKSALICVLISLGLILIFAISLKFIDISDVVIKIINQVIKIISIFFGVFFCQKTDKSRGLIKGILIGVIYSIFAYFVFSILNSKISFGLCNILDMLFSAIFGGICGIFCANFGVEEKFN